MMRLFISTIGDTLALAADWAFDLFGEYRNHDVRQQLGLSLSVSRWDAGERSDRVTLPAGTVLRVDRIYIRKGVGDFDSVTFWIVDSPDKRLVPKGRGGTAERGRRMRFWAKLADVNRIELDAPALAAAA